jgi:hypothetical protein
MVYVGVVKGIWIYPMPFKRKVTIVLFYIMSIMINGNINVTTNA